MEKQFYIYSFSNADTVNNPTNSLTKFRHKLNHELRFRDRNKWKIGLVGFFCHNQNLAENSDLVQIKCDQIEISENNPAQILSIHSKGQLDTSVTENVHHYLPYNIEYFSPFSDTISELSFTLLDANSKQLQLATGQPSWIVLHFKKMIRNNYREIIARVSSKKTALFPYNKSNNFRAVLPLIDNFVAQQQYEVCVNAMIYVPKFKQSYFKKKPFIKGRIISNTLGPETILEYSTDKDFSCEEDLVFYLGLYLNKLNLEHKILIQFNSDTQRIEFTSPTLPENNYINLSIPFELALQMGVHVNNPSADNSVDLKIHPKSVTITDRAVNINILVPRTILIYTNFTEPCLTGSVYSSLIKSFPINDSTLNQASSHITQQALLQEYHQLSYTQLENLSFRLLRVDGSEIQFKDESEVILSLSFRKKI